MLRIFEKDVEYVIYLELYISRVKKINLKIFWGWVTGGCVKLENMGIENMGIRVGTVWCLKFESWNCFNGLLL